MLRPWGARRRLIASATRVMVVRGMTLLGASASRATSFPVTAVTVPTALLVQVQAAAGGAAVDNSSPADVLVLVTNPRTGQAVTDLVQSNIAVINHFSHVGMSCGFSNNIVSFTNVGTGAYRVQVAPVGCAWAPGDFLMQVIVTSGLRGGQAAATLRISTRY
ncbi:MAG: hypothetical protein IPO93_08270 [Actinobacteria bacterium]|nr:hypothetical protein [Actinomycetota bacterium]